MYLRDHVAVAVDRNIIFRSGFSIDIEKARRYTCGAPRLFFFPTRDTNLAVNQQCREIHEKERKGSVRDGPILLSFRPCRVRCDARVKSRALKPP